jgi:hypothetical protein
VVLAAEDTIRASLGDVVADEVVSCSRQFAAACGGDPDVLEAAARATADAKRAGKIRSSAIGFFEGKAKDYRDHEIPPKYRPRQQPPPPPPSLPEDREAAKVQAQDRGSFIAAVKAKVRQLIDDRYLRVTIETKVERQVAQTNRELGLSLDAIADRDEWMNVAIEEVYREAAEDRRKTLEIASQHRLDGPAKEVKL